jgi:hypothetical protein
MVARQIEGTLKGSKYLFCLRGKCSMPTVARQPLEESLLARDVTFTLCDMSASLRHRVFVKAMFHGFFYLALSHSSAILRHA